jgi:hypothetical protein
VVDAVGYIADDVREPTLGRQSGQHLVEGLTRGRFEELSFLGRVASALRRLRWEFKRGQRGAIGIWRLADWMQGKPAETGLDH